MDVLCTLTVDMLCILTVDLLCILTKLLSISIVVHTAENFEKKNSTVEVIDTLIHTVTAVHLFTCVCENCSNCVIITITRNNTFSLTLI